MIDEIYLSKRIEPTGGHILSLTDNCKIASTALCFMVMFSDGKTFQLVSQKKFFLYFFLVAYHF